MIELIDVLDAAGAPRGIRKSKRDVHRDGDWHRAAHVWVIAPDLRLLLQKRARVKENWPGMWDVSVAGHVSAGESVEEAAIREAQEELGLPIAASELRRIAVVQEQCVLNDGTYFDNEIHEIFAVHRDLDLASLMLDLEEVEEVAWAAFAELARFALVPHAEEYDALRRYLQSC